MALLFSRRSDAEFPPNYLSVHLPYLSDRFHHPETYTTLSLSVLLSVVYSGAITHQTYDALC